MSSPFTDPSYNLSLYFEIIDEKFPAFWRTQDQQGWADRKRIITKIHNGGNGANNRRNYYREIRDEYKLRCVIQRFK